MLSFAGCLVGDWLHLLPAGAPFQLHLGREYLVSVGSLQSWPHLSPVYPLLSTICRFLSVFPLRVILFVLAWLLDFASGVDCTVFAPVGFLVARTPIRVELHRQDAPLGLLDGIVVDQGRDVVVEGAHAPVDDHSMHHLQGTPHTMVNKMFLLEQPPAALLAESVVPPQDVRQLDHVFEQVAGLSQHQQQLLAGAVVRHQAQVEELIEEVDHQSHHEDDNGRLLRVRGHFQVLGESFHPRLLQFHHRFEVFLLLGAEDLLDLQVRDFHAGFFLQVQVDVHLQRLVQPILGHRRLQVIRFFHFLVHASGIAIIGGFGFPAMFLFLIGLVVKIGQLVGVGDFIFRVRVGQLLFFAGNVLLGVATHGPESLDCYVGSPRLVCLYCPLLLSGVG